jgi:hypothetical protein
MSNPTLYQILKNQTVIMNALIGVVENPTIRRNLRDTIHETIELNNLLKRQIKEAQEEWLTGMAIISQVLI